MNNVPSSSPAEILAKALLFLPDEITIGIPDLITIRAAATFVAIPPTPVTLDVPLANRTTSGVIDETTGNNFAVRFPKSFTKPSAVVKITNKSAGNKHDTNAPNRSLSPNFSSVTETASFSLIIGTTPLSSKVTKVFRAFKCRS
jgi:hypothetical protein